MVPPFPTPLAAPLLASQGAVAAAAEALPSLGSLASCQSVSQCRMEILLFLLAQLARPSGSCFLFGARKADAAGDGENKLESSCCLIGIVNRQLPQKAPWSDQSLLH